MEVYSGDLLAVFERVAFPARNVPFREMLRCAEKLNEAFDRQVASWIGEGDELMPNSTFPLCAVFVFCFSQRESEHPLRRVSWHVCIRLGERCKSRSLHGGIPGILVRVGVELCVWGEGRSPSAYDAKPRANSLPQLTDWRFRELRSWPGKVGGVASS